jgi:hypothetical protein
MRERDCRARSRHWCPRRPSASARPVRAAAPRPAPRRRHRRRHGRRCRAARRPWHRRRDRQAELAAANVEPSVHRQRERRPAELDRVEPEQQVVHDRVADDRDLDDVGPSRTRGLGAHTATASSVERLAHRRRELAVAAGVHHGVGDPAHQVLAEADLRVHQARGGEHLSGTEVTEMHGDGRRADVDGEAVDVLLDEARPEADEVGSVPDGGRHLPGARPQRPLQVREQRQRSRARAAGPTGPSAPAGGGGNRTRGRPCPARPPRRCAGGRPDRPRWAAGRPPCAPPADAPGCPPARRPPRPRRASPGSPGAGPPRARRAFPGSAPRRRSRPGHVVGGRARCRAWRRIPPATSTWQRPQMPRPAAHRIEIDAEPAGGIEQAGALPEFVHACRRV